MFGIMAISVLIYIGRFVNPACYCNWGSINLYSAGPSNGKPMMAMLTFVYIVCVGFPLATDCNKKLGAFTSQLVSAFIYLASWGIIGYLPAMIYS